MRRTPRVRVLAIAALVVAAAGAAVAQFGGPRGRFTQRRNIGYDGRFTFVRVNYTTAPGGYWYGASRPGRTATRSPSRT